MELQVAFNIVLGLASALLSWILKRLVHDASSTLATLTRHGQELNDLRVHIPTVYTTKEELRLMFGDLTRQLNRIEEKLDRKVDR